MSSTPAFKRGDGGLYAVMVSLARPAAIRVGALGVVRFEPGTYLYVGSARRARAKRIARHRRRTKPLRWHIDYLRKKTRWEGEAVFVGRGGECALARRAADAVKGRVAVRRFGASDCGCAGHLIYTGMRPGAAVERLRALRKDMPRTMEADGAEP